MVNISWFSSYESFQAPSKISIHSERKYAKYIRLRKEKSEKIKKARIARARKQIKKEKDLVTKSSPRCKVNSTSHFCLYCEKGWVHICLCKDGDEDCENTSVCIPAEERRKDKILTLRRRLKEKILSFGRENVRRKNRSNGPEIKPTFLKSNQPSTPYKSLSPPNASVPSLSIENLKLIKQRIRQIEMKLDKEDCSCKIRFQPGSINRRLWRRMSGRQGGRKEARRRADSKSKVLYHYIIMMIVNDINWAIFQGINISMLSYHELHNCQQVGLITDKCFNSTLRCELCYHLKKFSLDATTVGDKASEFCKDGKYDLDFKSMSEDCITSDQLAEMYQGFIKVYTVLSIEDPFDHLTSATAIQIVGDDLLVTNRNGIATAIEKKNGKVKMVSKWRITCNWLLLVVKESPRNSSFAKLGILSQQGGGGSDRIPTFL